MLYVMLISFNYLIKNAVCQENIKIWISNENDILEALRFKIV